MRDTFPTVETPAPASAIPVVVSIPHSGMWIPESLLKDYAVAPGALLRDGDLWVDRLHDQAQAAGATVIRTPVSRFVVDLNRHADDVSPRAVAGARTQHREGYYGDRGVIWAVTTRGETIYRTPLSEAQWRARIETWHAPYHRALDQALRRLRRRFGVAVLLDAHSMPSRATALHRDPGEVRPDIVPGNSFGRSCHAWVTAAVVSHWRAHGLQVVLNRPYAGGAITRTFGRPAEGIHAIQVEVNRTLYMDEETLAPHAGLDRLRPVCTGLVEALGEAALAAPSREAGE